MGEFALIFIIKLNIEIAREIKSRKQDEPQERENGRIRVFIPVKDAFVMKDRTQAVPNTEEDSQHMQDATCLSFRGRTVSGGVIADDPGQ
ncbi:MAG: hypothetical protein BWX80_03560 [Candidatus Hydrogenedentes bacterium ADurb.Bin101]|nr:MAG: hypothetical protein BWX80_03560 [Candidatus Hydrogenedentes bacterium ADurb.Bin101]